MNIPIIMKSSMSEHTAYFGTKFCQKHFRDVEKSVAEKKNKPKFGPMPKVIAALPNIDGALCSTPQILADAHY